MGGLLGNGAKDTYLTVWVSLASASADGEALGTRIMRYSKGRRSFRFETHAGTHPFNLSISSYRKKLQNVRVEQQE